MLPDLKISDCEQIANNIVMEFRIRCLNNKRSPDFPVKTETEYGFNIYVAGKRIEVYDFDYVVLVDPHFEHDKELDAIASANGFMYDTL